MNKIAIIGAGNLGVAIAEGIVAKGLRNSNEIVLTRRKTKALEKYSEKGFHILSNNKTACEGASRIILCVQPKQLGGVLEEIRGVLTEHQVLVSVITGVQIETILQFAGKRLPVVRAMPNTAIAIGESITCLCGSSLASGKIMEDVKAIFQSLGEVLVIEERLMKAATVLGASGIAFFMRYLRAATQGGIQMGFHPEEAQQIAVQTAKGAAGLIIAHGNHPEVEIDKVTTPQGCTIAGLNEMEHQGLSSALIKGLLTSFEKINSIQ